MNIGPLFRPVYQAFNYVVPKIISIIPDKNILVHRIHYICGRQRLNNSLENLSIHNTSVLLQPNLPIYQSICGMKVRGRLQLRCKDCYFVARKERLYVMCKTHPRHKQTQMKKREYKTWILTSASQSKIRGW